MKKQFIAKLLVLAMVLSMVPVTILAAGATDAVSLNSGYYSVADDATVKGPVASDGVVEAEVSFGKAKVVLNTKAAESLADLAKDGEIVVEIKAEGADRIDVSLPSKALTEVAEETGADLTIKSDVATITIPNTVLTNEFGVFGNVRITAQATESSVGFSILTGGKALKNIAGLKVEF